MILFDGMEGICLLIMFISLFSLQNYENEKTFIGAQGKHGVYLFKACLFLIMAMHLVHIFVTLQGLLRMQRQISSDCFGNKMSHSL